MKLSLNSILCLLSVCTFGQAGTKTFDIQEISLQDTFLLRQIENFIDEQRRENENFKSGLGYIVVKEKSCYQGDTLRSYLIHDQYFSIDSAEDEWLLPACYTWVKERLVFFASDAINPGLVKYSKRSKRKLRKKLEPFLAPAEHLIVKDEQGNVVIDDPHFRPDENVPLHCCSRLIYIFKNKPPVVIESL